MQNYPDYIVIINREHTGCQQYCFYTLEEIKRFTERKPYRNENLIVLPLYNKQLLEKALLPAAEVHDHVKNQISIAKSHYEASVNLSKILLKQVQKENEQCAYWFISALSKLSNTAKNFGVNEILDLAIEAMPQAAQEYQDYLRGK